MTSSGGEPFFVTQDSSQGTVLPWVTAGRPAIATPVSTTTVDGTNQHWKSDGTAGGTSVVQSYPDRSNPSTLSVVNGAPSFSANDGIHTNQQGTTDGTAAGTATVTTPPQNGLQFDGATFFENTNFAGPAVSPIYRSDGSPGGASAIFTPDSSTVSMTGLVVSGNSLYFLTTESGDSGTAIDLWKSDGTSSGTAVLASIPAGQYSIGASNVTDANGTLFFVADTGPTDTAPAHYDLWSSDGTAPGTTKVTSLNGPMTDSATLGNELVFAQRRARRVSRSGLATARRAAPFSFTTFRRAAAPTSHSSTG